MKIEDLRIATLKNIEADKVIEIDNARTVHIGNDVAVYASSGNATARVISSVQRGQFKQAALALNHNFDWLLAKDTLGLPILIPLIKE